MEDNSQVIMCPVCDSEDVIIELQSDYMFICYCNDCGCVSGGKW